jgi:hypothetical protein
MKPRQARRPIGDNAAAAEIILADRERHGGEESLAVRWARLFLKNAEGEPGIEKNKQKAPLLSRG